MKEPTTWYVYQIEARMIPKNNGAGRGVSVHEHVVAPNLRFALDMLEKVYSQQEPMTADVYKVTKLGRAII